MARALPWRNRPTALIAQMIPVVEDYRLYLVHELGCTSFVFKDEEDNKFRVCIGNTLQCSCGVEPADHCLHTLFVLLKRFKVDRECPLLWQNAYLDSELEGLLSGKYSAKRSKAWTQARPNRIKAPKKTRDPAPDYDCAICYEELGNACKTACPSCNKLIHTKCLEVWVRHKHREADQVTCPLCRHPFANPIGLIATDLKQFELEHVAHRGVQCAGCRSRDFKGYLYRCLICAQCCLCQSCTQAGAHSIHEYFAKKEMSDSPWVFHHRNAMKYQSQALSLRLKQDNWLNEVPLADIVCRLFPTEKEHSVKCADPNNLCILGNEIVGKLKCHLCQQRGNESMLRLECAHLVHQECLQLSVSQAKYSCLCTAPFCPGLYKLKGVQWRTSPE